VKGTSDLGASLPATASAQAGPPLNPAAGPVRLDLAELPRDNARDVATRRGCSANPSVRGDAAPTPAMRGKVRHAASERDGKVCATLCARFTLHRAAGQGWSTQTVGANRPWAPHRLSCRLWSKKT